jgi:hypothetical protein
MLRTYRNKRIALYLFSLAAFFQKVYGDAQANSASGKMWIICVDDKYGHLIWAVNRVKAANPRMIPARNGPGQAMRLLDVLSILYEGDNILDPEDSRGMPSYDVALSSPMQYVIESFEALGYQMKPGSHPEIGIALPLVSANLNRIHSFLLDREVTVLVVRSSRGTEIDLLRRLTSSVFTRMLGFKMVSQMPKYEPPISKYDDKQIATLWMKSILPGIFVHPKEVKVYSQLGIIAVVLDDTDANLENLFGAVLSDAW